MKVTRAARMCFLPVICCGLTLWGLYLWFLGNRLDTQEQGSLVELDRLTDPSKKTDAVLSLRPIWPRNGGSYQISVVPRGAKASMDKATIAAVGEDWIFLPKNYGGLMKFDSPTQLSLGIGGFKFSKFKRILQKGLGAPVTVTVNSSVNDILRANAAKIHLKFSQMDRIQPLKGPVRFTVMNTGADVKDVSIGLRDGGDFQWSIATDIFSKDGIGADKFSLAHGKMLNLTWCPQRQPGFYTVYPGNTYRLVVTLDNVPFAPKVFSNPFSFTQATSGLPARSKR